jgi:hypothetical protein
MYILLPCDSILSVSEGAANMGQILNNRTLTANKLLDLPYPIILYEQRPDFEKAILDTNSQIFSLNLPLAQALSGKNINEITATITTVVIELLPKDSILCLVDYEMLFDPRYEINVIKLFCEISRYNKLIVKWCGSFDGDSLTYAEPGYDDYIKYRVSDYDITCIV